MSREIKFRAKVKGLTVYSNGFFKKYDGTIIVITKCDKDNFETSPIDEGSLSEFTGFQDKNGTDIYESDSFLSYGYSDDIFDVDKNSEVFHVFFNKSTASFDYKNKEGTDVNAMTRRRMRKFQVIEIK